MVSPSEFERMVLPHGTCAVITDPHEIANVAGTAGIRYMLEATKNLLLDVYFMCRPACRLPPWMSLVRSFIWKILLHFTRMSGVLGLAEMMNSYGVVQNAPDCVKSFRKSQEYGKQMDGHAPGYPKRD